MGILGQALLLTNEGGSPSQPAMPVRSTGHGPKRGLYRGIKSRETLPSAALCLGIPRLIPPSATTQVNGVQVSLGPALAGADWRFSLGMRDAGRVSARLDSGEGCRGGLC